jgi:Raf kinase inhibitor-like YbhB/YbcL family protein
MQSKIILTVVAGLLGQMLLSAPATAGQAAAAVRGGDPKRLAAARDKKSAAETWMWHMGMLRGVYEIDGVATLEIQRSTGSVRVGGQPCTLVNYRASINYQVAGMRVQYTCTRVDGQTHKAIEVVSAEYSWDEDIPGAELVPGKGKAEPNAAARNERLIRLWSSPQGAPKAAAAAGSNVKVTTVGGKTVLTYPIPGVAGAVATATLTNGAGDGPCARNCAERIEVRHGNVLTEFIYSNYEDYNEPANKVAAFFPGRIVERRDGVTILDLSIVETETGNLYVVMPVPESVRKASAQGQTASAAPAAAAQKPRLRLTSTGFSDAGRIPLQFTCYAAGGKVISPALEWQYVPDGTRSFVLILTGPENQRRRGHTEAFFWGRWNIPAETRQLAEGQPRGAELPDGSRQLPSDDGIVGYDPPCAPAGAGPIHYQFKLYALDQMLTLPANATREAVLQAMDGHIIGASVYYGTLERVP